MRNLKGIFSALLVSFNEDGSINEKGLREIIRYNIDKMKLGDNIVVDYEGARYAYEITKIFDVKPNQTEIEAPSQEAKLTLYSCELGGSDAGRIVITGKLLGQVEQ